MSDVMYVVVKTPDRDLLVRVPVGVGDDPGVLAESVFAELCSVEWFMADSMTDEQAVRARAAAGLTPAPPPGPKVSTLDVNVAPADPEEHAFGLLMEVGR